MKLPGELAVLIITLSDRAYKDEYADLSGPRIRDILTSFLQTDGWAFNINNVLIPDDSKVLRDLIVDARSKYNLIFTTGGTGIGPRDITVETVKPLITKDIPGIMEFIRIKYGAEKPNALLSRGVAGITGNSLIYTLPGSVRAVEEYMAEIVKTMKHTIYMQYGVDKHGV